MRIRNIKKNITRRRLWQLGVAAALFHCMQIGPVCAAAQEEHKLTLDITAAQHYVSGPGAAYSSLSTGHPYLNTELGYRYERTDGDKRFTLHFQGRGTNDQSVDVQTWSMSSLKLDWADKNRRLAVGDVMPDFSSYAFSSAVKGISYTIQPDGGAAKQIGRPKVNLLYGVGYPRWDNFWGGADLKTIRRVVSGINVQQSMSDTFDFGISFIRSGDSDRLADWDSLYQNKVYALNWEARPRNGLTIRGESAYSYTVKSPSATDADQAYHGFAHQVSVNSSGKRHKWLYEYEMVSPDFTTLLGSSISDRERMKVRMSQRVTPDMNMNIGLTWMRNQLPGSSQTYRTDLYQPELNFTFIEPFNRPDASLDVGLRLDRRFGGGTSTADRVATAAYRDIFGKVDADIGLEYQFNDTASTDYALRSKNLAMNVTLATSIVRENYTLKPVLTAAYTRNTDVIDHYNDRLMELSIGLGYLRPKENFSVTGKIGQNKNIKESSSDHSRWFGHLRIEGQPGYLRAMSPTAKQFLEVRINTYRFDNAGNNYRETSIVSGVHLEF